MLTNQLTVEGVISFQLVGYVIESENAEPQIIVKSPVVSGFVTQSINGVEAEADSNPNLLARIWAKIREWADKIHKHDNKNTLDAFGCQALDNPITDGDFNFGINTEDWNRLKFQGGTVLFSSDGAVVRNVEVKEDNGNQFFRMHFSKPGLDTSFEPMTSFVDIPINGTSDKTDIGLNGSGLELELPTGSTGGTDKIELATETATLQPNILYSFGEVATLTLEFAEGDTAKVNEYMFSFVSGETPTVLTLPSTVQWANELTVEANKRYEISIVDNIALWCAVEVSE